MRTIAAPPEKRRPPSESFVGAHRLCVNLARDLENFRAAASDELDDSWDLSGAVEDAQLGFWVGVAVAQATAMPTWRAGDEFESIRSAALKAAAP